MEIFKIELNNILVDETEAENEKEALSLYFDYAMQCIIDNEQRNFEGSNEDFEKYIKAKMENIKNLDYKIIEAV